MSNDSHRVSRVEKEVLHQIAQFVVSGKLHLPGLVTITRVMMPADLRSAKVYVSVLGSEKQRDEAIELLQERAFQVQKFVDQQLRMRYCPKLQFFADDTTEQIMKVDRILWELEVDRLPQEERNLQVIREEE